MKNEKTGVTIEVLVALKPKIYSFLVDDSGGHKKMPRIVNKNVAATISHNEHKDVLLNQKCLRNRMNKIQSKIFT